MKRIAVCLGLAQYQQLKQCSAQVGLTMAELIRRAIDASLQREQQAEKTPHATPAPPR